MGPKLQPLEKPADGVDDRTQELALKAGKYKNVSVI